MAQRNKPVRIGVCVSSHGFGHAARMAAVMETIGRMVPVEFVVMTGVPRWFFSDSLSHPFSYVAAQTDVGCVQKNALEEDLPATLQALGRMYPLRESQVEQAVRIFSGCALVLCDIAVLGIAAARRLGIASLLLENFTWDWIYGHYTDRFPAFSRHVEYLREMYVLADLHVQTLPCCQPDDRFALVGPIGRHPRSDRETTRKRLGMDAGGKTRMILVTMGGMDIELEIQKPLAEAEDCLFVLPGQVRRQDSPNICCLDKRSAFYHPDLIHAADAVVGKVGYSTLAEAYAASVPFGYIERPSFPESPALVSFVQNRMPSLRLETEELRSGAWLKKLPRLLTSRRPSAGPGEDAVRQVGMIVCGHLGLEPFTPGPAGDQNE